MKHEFQVFYAHAGQPVMTPVLVIADDKADALGLVKSFLQDRGAQQITLGCNDGSPLVDWSKPAFTREEAAVWLTCEPSGVDRYMADDTLPHANKVNGIKGRPLFTRAVLEMCVEFRMKTEEWRKRKEAA